jgi:hypothetical protein
MAKRAESVSILGKSEVITPPGIGSIGTGVVAWKVLGKTLRYAPVSSHERTDVADELGDVDLGEELLEGFGVEADV